LRHRRNVRFPQTGRGAVVACFRARIARFDAGSIRLVGHLRTPSVGMPGAAGALRSSNMPATLSPLFGASRPDTRRPRRARRTCMAHR
jgi:hypothetical protein